MCKCYRFAYYQLQGLLGGCDDKAQPQNGGAGAGGREEEADPGASKGKTELLPEKPVIPRVDEDSSVEDIGRWVRGLKHLPNAEQCAQSFELQQINGYVLLELWTDENILEFCEKSTPQIKMGPRLIIQKGIQSLKACAASKASSGP